MSELSSRIKAIIEHYEIKQAEKEARDRESDRIIQQQKLVSRWKNVLDFLQPEISAVVKIIEEHSYPCRQHLTPEFHPYNQESYIHEVRLTVSPHAVLNTKVLNKDFVVKQLLDRGSTITFSVDPGGNRMQVTEVISDDMKCQFFLYLDEIDQQAVTTLLEDFVNKVFI